MKNTNQNKKKDTKEKDNEKRGAIEQYKIHKEVVTMKFLRVVLVIGCLWFFLAPGEEVLSQPERKKGFPGRAEGRHAERWDKDIASLEKEFFDFLDENLPSESEEIKSELLKLKERDTDAYEKRLRQASRRMRFILHMKDRNPERFEKHIRILIQEMKSMRLVAEYREAKSDEEREKIRAELKTKLEEIFDEKIEDSQSRVKELEEEIEKLKQEAQDRKDKKDEIISRRLEGLLSPPDLDW